MKVTVESTRMVMVRNKGHKVPSFNVKVTVESTRMVMVCQKIDTQVFPNFKLNVL